MLGLGLGLNKGGYIKPLPKWLTDAGCTFAINVDRQVKALANPNSPFINPLVDITKKGNNVTLQSFAGTTADGYTQIALPNGKNPWFLECDGTNSIGTLLNTADLDPVGLDDFAISIVFRTSSTIVEGMLFSKALSGYSETQYGILTRADGRISAAWNNIFPQLAPAGSVVANTLYELLVYRTGGRLVCELNKVSRSNVANSEILVTRPHVRFLCRSTTIDGLTNSTFFKGSVGSLAFAKAPQNTLDITKLKKALDKLNANYI